MVRVDVAMLPGARGASRCTGAGGAVASPRTPALLPALLARSSRARRMCPGARRQPTEAIASTAAAARAAVNCQVPGEPLAAPAHASPPRATAPAHPRQPCGRPADRPPCSASRFRLPMGLAALLDTVCCSRRSAAPPRRRQVAARCARDAAAASGTGPSGPVAGCRCCELQPAARASRRRAACQGAPEAGPLGRRGVAPRPRRQSPTAGRPPRVQGRSTCTGRGRVGAVGA